MDKNTNTKEMSTYIATLIHDLKTPVTAQISAVELLLNNTFGKLNSDQKEILEQIKQSCEYSKNLIYCILDTYLYENGQIKPKPEKFNWNNLINNIINETSALAKEKAQNIVIKSEITEKEIFADKFQIKRAIINLISNAIKYGFSNSTIEIETTQNQKDIIFNVKNCSKYINTEMSENFFSKFVRNKNDKNSMNCGLGLYLTKKIISAHNGKVFGECKKTGECNFGFSLPKNF